jgi:transposase-like protein
MAGKAKRTDLDWEEIERVYCASERSVFSIAKQHGVTSNTITERAKKYGWFRPNREDRRTEVAKVVSNVDQKEIQTLVANSTQLYIDDMNRGLTISRNCLLSLERASETASDPRDIKTITEATKSAVETIRSIGGLDPIMQQSNTTNIQINNSEQIALIIKDLQTEY